MAILQNSGVNGVNEIINLSVVRPHPTEQAGELLNLGSLIRTGQADSFRIKASLFLREMILDDATASVSIFSSGYSKR